MRRNGADPHAKASQLAQAARARLVAIAPDEPLAAIRYLSVALHEKAPEVRHAIDVARNVDPPFTWRQIAAALGKDDSDTAGRRLQERHTYVPKNR